jgi:hypothetical protein
MSSFFCFAYLFLLQEFIFEHHSQLRHVAGVCGCVGARPRSFYDEYYFQPNKAPMMHSKVKTKGWHHIVDTMRPLTSQSVVTSAFRAQRFFHFPCVRRPSFIITQQFAMKRSAATASLKTGTQSPKKSRPSKPSISVPEYHSTPSKKDSNGEIIWPAPKSQIEVSRNFIRDWYVISSLPMPNT